MAVYAILNTKDSESNEFIFNSLKEGKARFGWSYHNEFNLMEMNDMSWDEFDTLEKEGFKMYEVWGKAKWLLNINAGDYFVYINQPEYGLCSIVKIIGNYNFDNNSYGDFRHNFDCEYISTFNRNNDLASKLSYSSLRPRSRYQRIYDEEGFFLLLEELKNKNKTYIEKSDDIIGSSIDSFVNDVYPYLLSKVKHYFSQKRFEDFIMQILDYRTTMGEIKNPYVYRGWGVDTGCDIKFEYFNPIINMYETVIMQLKAYEGTANVSYAINNLRSFLKNSNDKVNQAIVMTTAETINIDEYNKAKEGFEKEFKIPINVLYGKSMIAWLLKYGGDMLFNEVIE